MNNSVHYLPEEHILKFLIILVEIIKLDIIIIIILVWLLLLLLLIEKEDTIYLPLRT